MTTGSFVKHVMLPCSVCRVWPFTWPLLCPPPCRSWWPCPVLSRGQTGRSACCGPFFSSFHSLQRLMNWLCGCCQCVCAPGEGVPVTGGNPSYGIHPGVAIVADLQGALGGCWPWEQLRLTYCCHTLGDTAALLLRTPLISSDKTTFSGELQGDFSWCQQLRNG